MKIYVIGMSASGKTTISTLLAVHYDIKSLDLDNIYWDLRNIKPDKQILRKRKDVEEKLSDLLKKKDWIVNGIYLEKVILEKADKIIFMKQNLVRALFWQWKRYFQDTVQRQIYGFKNNVNLSKIILKQHLNTGSSFEFDSYHYVTAKTMETYLKKEFRSKLIVASPGDFKNVVNLLV